MDRKSSRTAEALIRLSVAGLIIGVIFLGHLQGAEVGYPSPARAEESQSSSRTHDHEGETETVWTCSMHPQVRLPAQGKCPICFMDLIPLKKESPKGEGGAVSLRQITLSPQARKLAEVTVHPVKRTPVGVETRMVGKVDYDETRMGYITAWTGGRIDKLYVAYTGSVVRKGQPMALIYSPELLTAQAELIQALKAIKDIERSGLKRVKESALRTELATRKKLELLGLSRSQIEEVAQKGTPADHVTLQAPMSGVVIKKDVVEGMYVKTGTLIYTIADLSRVWVVLEAYESDLPWVKLGQEILFSTDAYPGEIFRGRAVYIDPFVNERTRTVGVRIDVPNPGGRLKPGMFVRGVKRTLNGASLVIPASAPLITGKRAIVYVRAPGKEGTYEGREILLGPRAGNYYVVKSGLSEGELVVTKGNFKIDSSIQLSAGPSMMSDTRGATGLGHPGDQALYRVPAAMGRDFLELAGLHDEIAKTLEGRDLAGIRRAYGAFHERLRTIDPASLEGRPALIWKELSMLLGNDSFLGSESDSPEEAAHLFQTLTDHLGRLRAEFDFSPPPRAGETAAGVPESFKAGLGKVLEAYLAIHRALASDDPVAAREAGKALKGTLGTLDMTALNGEAHMLWMGALEVLREGLGEILEGGDISVLRHGFRPLSAGLISALRGLGVKAKGPVYEMYCSMAFENQGAGWLQMDKDDIRNPYFGAAMLRCGEVKDLIGGK